MSLPAGSTLLVNPEEDFFDADGYFTMAEIIVPPAEWLGAGETLTVTVQAWNGSAWVEDTVDLGAGPNVITGTSYIGTIASAVYVLAGASGGTDWAGVSLYRGAGRIAGKRRLVVSCTRAIPAGWARPWLQLSDADTRPWRVQEAVAVLNTFRPIHPTGWPVSNLYGTGGTNALESRADAVARLETQVVADWFLKDGAAYGGGYYFAAAWTSGERTWAEANITLASSGEGSGGRTVEVTVDGAEDADAVAAVVFWVQFDLDAVFEVSEGRVETAGGSSGASTRSPAAGDKVYRSSDFAGGAAELTVNGASPGYVYELGGGRLPSEFQADGVTPAWTWKAAYPVAVADTPTSTMVLGAGVIDLEDDLSEFSTNFDDVASTGLSAAVTGEWERYLVSVEPDVYVMRPVFNDASIPEVTWSGKWIDPKRRYRVVSRGLVRCIVRAGSWLKIESDKAFSFSRPVEAVKIRPSYVFFDG